MTVALENVIYYTLSTMAQALAGVLGIVLAVFLSNTNRLEDVFPTSQHANPQRASAAAAVPSRPQNALGLSLIVIGVCFAALLLTPWLVMCGAVVALIVLGVIVLCGTICLPLYWRLVVSVIALVKR